MTRGLLITESLENLGAPEAAGGAHPATSSHCRPERRGRDLAPVRRRAPELRRTHNPASAAAAAGEVRGGGQRGRGRCGDGRGARGLGRRGRIRVRDPGLQGGPGKEEPDLRVGPAPGKTGTEEPQ